jgi:hypothetical protein
MSKASCIDPFFQECIQDPTCFLSLVGTIIWLILHLVAIDFSKQGNGFLNKFFKYTPILLLFIFASCEKRDDKTYYKILSIETYNNKVSIYEYWNSYYGTEQKLIDSCNKWKIGDTIKFK